MRPTGIDRGIVNDLYSADIASMIWPVAALAVFLLGFVVVYGSVLQARLEPRLRGAADDSGVDTDIA
jgi:hypothetical protein